MAKTRIWKILWDRKYQLFVCALLFQSAESLVFAPLLGLAGHALLGRPVVDSTGLVSFVLSPRGFGLLFLGSATLLTIRLLEQAGLSAIALGALQGKTVRVAAALRLTMLKLPGLVSIATRIVLWGLVVAAPVLAVAGIFAARLLPKHDINFYLANWPSEFILAAVLIGLVGVAALVLGVWLLVRWRLVVQVCLFDGRRGRAAFREAAALSQGVRWPLAWRCLAVLGFELILALAAAGLAQVTIWMISGAGALGTLSLAVSFGFVLLFRTVVSAAVISIGACVEAALFTVFYLNRRQVCGGGAVLPGGAALEESSAPNRRLACKWAAATVLGLCASEVFGAFVLVDAFKNGHPVTVTAHRGGHSKAPENTAASIREAIAVGAQYAEIDVQLTKDGVLVVTHDSDFSRMGGVAKKVWDLNYDEIRAIPLGAGAAPEFRNECAPTFDEVLALAKSHIKLNVELKFYGDHQPRLVERVIKEIRARDMAAEVIIQCLEYDPLQEVRRLAPEIPVGYLLSVNARDPSRLKVDFLGTALSRATGAFVRAAHRRGQQVHVWTVDTPESMTRMIDIGVDSLITNEPGEALRLVREYENLSPAERALRGFSVWLAP